MFEGREVSCGVKRAEGPRLTGVLNDIECSEVCFGVRPHTSRSQEGKVDAEMAFGIRVFR